MVAQESDFDSIREKIIQALETRLVTMVPDALSSNPYAFKFDQVVRNDFNSNVQGKEYAAAIIDSDERHVEDTYPVCRSEVDVVLEFLVYVKAVDKPTRKINKVFSEVRRRIMEDQTLGDLAIKIKFDRNETELNGRFDKYIEGAMFFTIQYRHNIEDPRRRV